MARSERNTSGRIAANVALLVFAAAFLLPMLWVVTTALSGDNALRVEPPHPFTLHNFAKVATWDTTFHPILNSLIICVGGTAITVVVSILAAYPLSRYRSKLKRPFMLTVLFAGCLPITALMIPVYIMFNAVQQTDSIPATILFMGTNALPIAIWMTKNFMDAVPTVLEEAAWTDGAGSMQTLRRVVLPLMWPGVLVVTIFSFVGMWGNYFVPFLLLTDPSQLPAAVSIYSFFGKGGGAQYGQLAAFSIFYIIPIAVLYIIVSRRQGANALGGALKG